MRKFNLVFALAFACSVALGSGNASAAPSSNLSLSSQPEIVQVSLWTDIRDAVLGREPHPHHRHYHGCVHRPRRPHHHRPVVIHRPPHKNHPSMHRPPAHRPAAPRPHRGR